MRALTSFLKAIERSSVALLLSMLIGAAGLLVPTDRFVHFGVLAQTIEQLALGCALIIVPAIVYVQRAIGIYKRSDVIRHVLEPPRQIDFARFSFRIPRYESEIAVFVTLSNADSNIFGSYDEGEIDRGELYRKWRSWRPDAFLGLIKSSFDKISIESVQALSIILPLKSSGIEFFKNGGRARDLLLEHIAQSGMHVDGLLLDTWIVQPKGIVEISGQKRILREQVSRHQNALYLLHMSLFWHVAKNMTVIFEDSNPKLVEPLVKRGFKKIFPSNTNNKHYIICIKRSDYVDNSFASSVLFDLKRFRRFKGRL